MDTAPFAKIGRDRHTFQCIVRIELREMLAGELSEDGHPVSPMIGYFRTVGVTANDPADAVARVTKYLRQLPEEPGTPRGGYLHDLWLVATPPDSIDTAATEAPLTKAGVWYISGRIYFNDSDDAIQEAAAIAREVLLPTPEPDELDDRSTFSEEPS